MKIARRFLLILCAGLLASPWATPTVSSAKTSARHSAAAADDDDATPAPKRKRVRKAKAVKPEAKSPDSSNDDTDEAATPPAPAPPAALPIPGTAPRTAPNTRAASVIVIDARTGEVLYEKNADAQRAIASTQKLLTALIVAERGYLDQSVTVIPADTYAEPTKLGFRAGETYPRMDLLRVLLVHSCNDVARCLARDAGGSIENFAEIMNQKARSLGATNSHFLNPNGLPMPGQYSTARDLSLIARAAYANSTIRSIVSIPHLVFRYADGHTRDFDNTNKVLRRLPYCNGMKTGYTDAAGHCLVSSATRPGRDVISVVLGDPKSHVWIDSAALLTWGLSI
ncbi:MAG: D-alanyl-D-alanine carboxypeptidase [Verrucomicrobiota bacterium]|nr:D-alanyl-D-alanine carboxypeptidase [Verrucomicrobiota bacterium]